MSLYSGRNLEIPERSRVWGWSMHLANCISQGQKKRDLAMVRIRELKRTQIKERKWAMLNSNHIRWLINRQRAKRITMHKLREPK